ncbi:hypothetical protein NAF17_00595 [Mucilaginibacter sp. RB4R14]|uniref:hypothetical protein n=1 Tax=Mucilaginibacter aurantiaciroseus TaxID=2949308 RepID=UPI002091D5D4|nr:hypothetical protein [Mucilaginibacter aurantiaciroseus]MCO5934021.1 hypothetical protein [Mucilaginibacter aurantiaciroseus]
MSLKIAINYEVSHLHKNLKHKKSAAKTGSAFNYIVFIITYFKMPKTALRQMIAANNNIMLDTNVACGKSTKRKYIPTKPITTVKTKNL